MNPHEQQPAGEASATRATMSAWADGQVDAGDAALALWAADGEARRSWHAYQLIGDVLRSEELAGSPGRDEALLQRVRLRLAQESAIVAPSGDVTPRQSAARTLRRRWSIGAAAAGFVMVAGVASVMQRGVDEVPVASRAVASEPAQAVVIAAPEAMPGRLARVSQAAPAPTGPAASTRTASGAPGASAADPQWRMLDGQVIRDARLDAYLRAHRGTGSVPARFETVVLDR